MADIKVSEMQSATSLNPDDLIMVVQSGSNKKATFDLFKEIPIDNLNSTSTTDALSANQGKVLNDKILGLNIPSVVDNLTSTSATNALSANQGKVLNDSITNTNNKITTLGTFSTNEVKTGEKWIDGKPIYKKVMQVTPTDTTSHVMAHNIANIDKIWVSGDSFLWVDTASIPLNYWRNADTYSWGFADRTNVQYKVSSSGWANKPMYIALKYTKTTD